MLDFEQYMPYHYGQFVLHQPFYEIIGGKGILSVKEEASGRKSALYSYEGTMGWLGFDDFVDR